MTTELEHLADESLYYLCNRFCDEPGFKHRDIMRASFEIFRNDIVCREHNEKLLEERKKWYKIAYRWE